ncbi:ATP-binding protein [Actinocorallia longicatena]|uniref:ATP-binding protein n=1 Tax=Actinocorallia longicatena TaxID=111803 RepID=A0ABP6QID5_9ACTN
MTMTADWMCCSDLTLGAADDAPYWARRSAENTLGAWKVHDPDGVVLLMVSELVTNAVAVSGPADPVRLRLIRLADRVRVTVWDRCSLQPAVRAADGEAALENEDGRGLWLVENLSIAWGWMLEASGGKFVWCEFLCDQWP